MILHCATHGSGLIWTPRDYGLGNLLRYLSCGLAVRLSLGLGACLAPSTLSLFCFAGDRSSVLRLLFRCGLLRRKNTMLDKLGPSSAWRMLTLEADGITS